jgi:hypothetical protein
MSARYEKEYSQMFDYLSAPSLPSTPESTVVFGRKDPLVARAAGDLAKAGLVDLMVITGGIGKDSGDIVQQGFDSEAAYLESELENDARARAYTLPRVILEPKASNGGENARNSLVILDEAGAPTGPMTAVAHATSARRLAEGLKFEAGKRTGTTPNVFVKPSAYRFDVTSPADQAEARAELLRLADWPNKDWLLPQVDLPLDLVDFARRENDGGAPRQPSRLTSSLFGALPARVRQQILKSIDRR